jgi:hypothetical protein
MNWFIEVAECVDERHPEVWWDDAPLLRWEVPVAGAFVTPGAFDEHEVRGIT